jgi:hypothetical protein
MIGALLEIFLYLLLIGGLFAQIIGVMVLVSFCLPIKPPADTSNRINRIRLFWYAISAPHRSIKSFYWLQGDETDNLKDNTWDDYNGR